MLGVQLGPALALKCGDWPDFTLCGQLRARLEGKLGKDLQILSRVSKGLLSTKERQLGGWPAAGSGGSGHEGSSNKSNNPELGFPPQSSRLNQMEPNFVEMIH